MSYLALIFFTGIGQGEPVEGKGIRTACRRLQPQRPKPPLRKTQEQDQQNPKTTKQPGHEAQINGWNQKGNSKVQQPAPIMT
jgi:hypothetical protein